MADRKTVRLQTIGVVVPPEIQTDGAYLYWSVRKYCPSPTGLPWENVKVAHPSRNMLDRFVALADAEPEMIRAFSGKYGVLGICAQHKMPSSHDLDCDLLGVLSENWWAEPLDRWRFYAGQFRSVLRISIELNKGRLGEKEDWAILDPEQDHTFSKRSHKTVWLLGLAGARQRLAGVVSDLVELGAVRPDLVWENGHWNIFYHSIGNEPMFGALAIQLMLAVASVDGFATCSACGNPYIPERTPDPNGHNFCSLPCRKVGRAMASRTYRVKLNARGKRLDPRGPEFDKPTGEISSWQIWLTRTKGRKNEKFVSTSGDMYREPTLPFGNRCHWVVRARGRSPTLLRLRRKLTPRSKLMWPLYALSLVVFWTSKMPARTWRARPI